MAFRINTLFFLALLLLLSACAQTPNDDVPPAWQESSLPSSDTQVAKANNPYYSRAQSALDAGDYDQALTLFESALRIDPKNADVWRGMAEANVYLHHASQSLLMANKGLRYAETSEQRYELWRVMNLAYQFSGNRKAAEAAYDAMQKEKP